MSLILRRGLRVGYDLRFVATGSNSKPLKHQRERGLGALRQAVVDTAAIKCPVLCVVGADDKIVSPQTARKTAAGYPGATFWELEGHGHMLVLEPGAEDIARRIADWCPR